MSSEKERVYATVESFKDTAKSLEETFGKDSAELKAFKENFLGDIRYSLRIMMGCDE